MEYVCERAGHAEPKFRLLFLPLTIRGMETEFFYDNHLQCKKIVLFTALIFTGGPHKILLWLPLRSNVKKKEKLTFAVG